MGQFETWLLKGLPRGVPKRPDVSPASEWLDPATLAEGGWEFKNAAGKVAGVFLGRWQGKEYGVMDDRHVLTVAGSRAGKGASLIVPNLLQYQGSVIAVDPKGELARVTAHARAKMGDVLILDPFKVSGHVSGALNPLDMINFGSPEAIDEALGIAEAMIQVPEQGERHWAESAQAVVQALILFVKMMPVEAERNLSTVHDLLMLNHASLVSYAARNPAEKNLVNSLFDMLDDVGEKILEHHPEIATVLRGIGKTYRLMPNKERESVLSSCRTQTRFLRSPSLRAVLSAGAIRLSQIKRETTTIYLCLPVRRMASHAKWLRVIINMCLQSFEDDYKPEIPVLMVLDEFNVLGHMRSIEVAAGQLAGFGVKLWTVLQDLGQIKKEYGRDGWETFVGNAGVITFFGNTDQTTLDYIAEKLGKRTFLTERPSDATQGGIYDGAPLMRQEVRQEALLAPHEISRFLARNRGSILVLSAEKPPIILQRAHYYDRNDRFYKLAHPDRDEHPAP